VNELDFSEKTILVVGGSSGIGNGIAQAFRQRGGIVHVWGTQPTIEQYSSVQGSNLQGLHYAQVDVSDMHAIDSHESAFTKLDVLVLAQGIVLYERKEYQIEGFRRVVDINLNSVMACCIKYHPLLKVSEGVIITIGSTAAFQATLGNPAYNASKAGGVGLTRTLATAWARDGIRVNGIAPGLVETKLTKVTTGNPRRLQAALERIPLKRLGTPEDISGAALFLASPLAAYIIGQTIPVDGGLLLS
jgi:3-oxoacyl-[acyl-carrier protein] reductase